MLTSLFKIYYTHISKKIFMHLNFSRVFNKKRFINQSWNCKIGLTGSRMRCLKNFLEDFHMFSRLLTPHFMLCYFILINTIVLRGIFNIACLNFIFFFNFKYLKISYFFKQSLHFLYNLHNYKLYLQSKQITNFFKWVCFFTGCFTCIEAMIKKKNLIKRKRCIFSLLVLKINLV